MALSPIPVAIGDSATADAERDSLNIVKHCVQCNNATISALNVVASVLGMATSVLDSDAKPKKHVFFNNFFLNHCPKNNLFLFFVFFTI